MVFIFDENAGNKELVIKNETYKYLFKVRRHNISDIITFRSESDTKVAHDYEVMSMDGRKAYLHLIKSELRESRAQKNLHVAWCIIDTKSIEKVLAMLNEIGVSKISFIECDRSQKNFKLDFERMKRILLASMQQCGRTHLMELEAPQKVASFLEKHPDTVVFDFTETILEGSEGIETILVGCEGGFSKEEKSYLQSQKVVRLDTPSILRSESATVAISSKILL